ncbi:aminotransferase class I/II-fold pyridoxal phosphate-dependent enzyme [Mesorhizobium sp. M0016]|uniref:trans-sulfuration enzyme family protein n=1 Tax=Mesorhizobium sp. M0016 TaxID=2956843 RepID=UPI003335D1EC
MNDFTEVVLTPKVRNEGFDPLGTAVHRASTIVFENAEAYANRAQRGPEGYSYGLYGTPTTRTLEQKLTKLEGGVRTFLAPSGQAANSVAMLSFLKAGDNILLVDTSYPPVRDFANQDLARFQIETRYFDPSTIDDLESKIDERTAIVWCESPGSTSMDVQDIPAIVAVARRRGILVGCDNTWATPLNFKPILHGVHIVTEALTKYISGHSDILMGSITIARPEHEAVVKGFMGRFGIGVSPDDAALVLRGMETLGIRMQRSFESARTLVEQIERHPLVDRVLWPPLAHSPGHEFWKRDFVGASGVFGVLFKDACTPHVSPALDVLTTFAIGASWGGTRSLVAPMPVRQNRTATEWLASDLVLRISVGIEALEDLQADVARLLEDISVRTAQDRSGTGARSYG